MIFAAFTWLLFALSVAGGVANIRKHRVCFLLWGLTGLGWLTVALSYGIWAQAAREAVFTVLACVGWWSWRHNGEVVT